MPLANGKNFWLHNTDVTNGLVDITSGGWLKVDKTSCRASTADFRINCAMNVQVQMDVRDYIAVYGSNYNDGNGIIKVHGRFVPSETHNYFHGCEMQGGSTIDFGARTNALNVTSSFSSGAKTLGFANNATVTVDLSKRPDNLRQFIKTAEPFVLVWTTEPDASVNFIVDAETARRGLKLKRRTITIGEETETPTTKSGLMLVDAGAFTLFIK